VEELETVRTEEMLELGEEEVSVDELPKVEETFELVRQVLLHFGFEILPFVSSNLLVVLVKDNLPLFTLLLIAILICKIPTKRELVIHKTH